MLTQSGIPNCEGLGPSKVVTNPQPANSENAAMANIVPKPPMLNAAKRIRLYLFLLNVLKHDVSMRKNERMTDRIVSAWIADIWTGWLRYPGGTSEFELLRGIELHRFNPEGPAQYLYVLPDRSHACAVGTACQ